jgi:saccharopine dehydrogenase-like NADP-dependent oxidoreductase
MSVGNDILIIGGYGEVGHRLALILGERVIVAGRNPDRARGMRARRVDVDDRASIDEALEGIGVVVACVRQSEPHLLHAAVRKGIAYTSIAPPWIEPRALEPLHREAERSGARIILATGIEPGISSVLARIGADRIGDVDAIETALLLSVGDAYGADSMAFIFEELAQPYTILVHGRSESAYAFDRSWRVDFPEPIGRRRVYTMPFRDQLYYPTTLGAKTAVARLALDPPWLGGAIAMLTRMGARSAIGRGRARERLNGLTQGLRRHYAALDRFALVVEARSGGRIVRSTLVGRGQAQATAVGAAAIAEALHTREMDRPGVWLAEQVIAPTKFLERLAARGLVPVTEEYSKRSNSPPSRCGGTRVEPRERIGTPPMGPIS